MLKIILLSIIVLIHAQCAEDQTIIENDEFLLYLDFDDHGTSPFSDQLVYNRGIDGKGLDLEKSTSIPELMNKDTNWFSNDRDFSISLWLKSGTETSDTTIVISNADFSKEPTDIYGFRRTNKGITLYSSNGGWGWNIGNGVQHYYYAPITSDQPLADDQWHQLVFTHNAALKEVRLFYDGINKAILHIGDLDDENFISELPLRIGNDVNVSPGYHTFQGYLDELQVWKSVLTPDVVRKEFGKYGKVANEPKMVNNTITIVNWNIWHGGTHFNQEEHGFDGVERIIELITNAGADIVLMQETYGAGSIISSTLGYYYYEAGSTIGAVWGANLSVMSRFPIEDAYMIEEPSNYGNNYAFNNGGVKIKLSQDKSVVAFTNWYNGSKPEDLDGALQGWEELVMQSDTVPIIFGGDFNSVSHLDDGEGKSGHSKLMAGAGFIDTYRSLYPDPEAYPGYTAGRFQDRIDYIYYKGEKLELLEAGPIDPNFRGKEEKTPGYPSDHLGLVSKFKVKH